MSKVITSTLSTSFVRVCLLSHGVDRYLRLMAANATNTFKRNKKNNNKKLLNLFVKRSVIDKR